MTIKFTVSLKGATRRDAETGALVGFCPALKVYSLGRTEAEAMEALESELRLYLETCYEHGILHAVLAKAGFNKKEQGQKSGLT